MVLVGLEGGNGIIAEHLARKVARRGAGRTPERGAEIVETGAVGRGKIHLGESSSAPGELRLLLFEKRTIAYLEIQGAEAVETLVDLVGAELARIR